MTNAESSFIEIPESPRILVVDDEEAVLHIIQEILKKFYDVTILQSPVDALDLLHEQPFEIMITDIRMDGLSGIDLIRETLKIRPWTIPIAITGYASKDIAVKAFKEGVYDFLEKPFSLDLVLRCVDRAWNNLRVRMENANLMAELKTANQILRKSQEDLEKRVAHRTEDLKKANENLNRELTVGKEMQRRIHEALDLNRKIIESSRLGITAYRSSGKCILANDAWAAIMDISRETALSMNFREPGVCRDCEVLQTAETILANGGAGQAEIKTADRAGDLLWLDYRFASFKLEDEPHLLIVIDDITSRKASEAKIRHYALHDPLTGLPNRILFFDRLNQGVSRAKRFNTQVAVLFIDLDEFKPINDSFGHIAGDGFLKASADRLKSCLRESDTVARLGGDEFGAVLQDLHTRKDAEVVVERLLHVMKQPALINDIHEAESTVSIGVAVYPEDGSDADSLLSKADAAMYRVKRAGKGFYLFYQNDYTADPDAGS